MNRLTPMGTASERFRGRASTQSAPAETGRQEVDVEGFESSYLGWEIARCARGLLDKEQRALGSLAAAAIASMRGGSTRLLIHGEALASALAAVGAGDALDAARQLLARARSPRPGEPVAAVMGRPGERKPLIVEGEWLYAERMLVLEERFCARVRRRLDAAVPGRDARGISRALTAVASGPPVLTDEQRRAVRASLGASFALVTGGPGTGKTTTAVGLLRALLWMGVPIEGVAIAAPTGKAAQRLAESITRGLEAARGDIADAGLRANAPAPQTLHRLLGWSPSTGRFSRHENDPLAQRVVIVDEASMIDLGMMDRLVRALRPDARLVLFGDADQLPSIEAGAVFRDLCASLGASRLSVNLRVSRDASARRLVDAASAVNSGATEAPLAAAVDTRRSAGEVGFEGVEHLAASWSDVERELLPRWWRVFVGARAEFGRRISRIYRSQAGAFDEHDRGELRSLHDDYARARVLCVTRARGLATSADAINDRLLAFLRAESSIDHAWLGSRGLALGTPIVAQRNDYERGVFNGDQGVVVLVDPRDGGGVRPMAAFPRSGGAFDAIALDAAAELAPAFAMTVHKAQGSEFDHVALVLPDADMPLLTRELVYTAVTRARRSVLVVGSTELLVRAVGRPIERFSGIAERLRKH